ncbi:MAG TPA: hypothetical protein VGJ05_02580 [Fimbriiglobus sp.]
MRKSGAITLAVIGGLLLTGCLCGGCGNGVPRYRTLYDRQKHAVPRDRWFGPDGKSADLFDENGNPVPADQVRAAYNTPVSYSSSSHWHTGPHFFFWGNPWSSGRSWGGGSGPSRSGSIFRGGFGGSGHSAMGGGS